ncbi:hypothetical protein V494_08336 [Pseudogymnoascus sp. VKM F-4513 (FW-928)]|nr:hypothetical protein V494_08336 [Pseudogymnoascus sp. VKM F-4513 (FW-928)]
MPPKKLAVPKAITARLPPLPKLRVKRPNQNNSNPCLGLMTSVLTCWASSGHSVAGCSALETSLRACMDTPVSNSRFRRIWRAPIWDVWLMEPATTEIEGHQEEQYQLPFVENVPADGRTEEEEVKGAQDAADGAKLLPGPGYDTSASLLTTPVNDGSSVTALFELLAEKLTSWDAIYFTTVAKRGYLHEQEWAFAWGWTNLISFFSSELHETSLAHLPLESLVGTTIAHASHGLSVFALYHLACAIFPGPSGPKLAFIAGCLHTFSPAGIFLSAPCGESTAAFLTFLGLLFFAWGMPAGTVSSGKQDGFVVLAGVTLGLSTTVRSNALLNGIVFAEEAVLVAWSVRNGLSVPKIRRLAAVGVGGCCIAAGFLLPQYIAYQEYCTSASPRPWCSSLTPSIYTFVQEHYWDVGFLRYWKVSNIPLFLLAAPALVILISSGLRTADLTSRETTRPSHNVDHYKVTPAERALSQRTIRLLRSLSYPQLVLAVLAITNYHVQIITRLASASPVWYLWLAYSLLNGGEAAGKVKSRGRWNGWEKGVVMYMVIPATSVLTRRGITLERLSGNILPKGNAKAKMWPNNNFGSYFVPALDSAEDNNCQSNINQENFQRNYQGTEINQGDESFVNFTSLTAGIPVYPLFPYDYYPNFMGGYIPNMFPPVSGFGNNAFLETTFPKPADLENTQIIGPVAPAHLHASTQPASPIRPSTSAQVSGPPQPSALTRAASSMALNTRAEELKAQLIKSKAERAKAKGLLKIDGISASTLDPTSQEMASLLRGSPTMPKNSPKSLMSGSTFSTLPENILKGTVEQISGPKSTRIAISTSKVPPPPDKAGAVQSNPQSKGSQTKLNLMPSKPATSQVKAKVIQNIDQKPVSKVSQKKVQAERIVLGVVGNGNLPSTPGVVKDQVLPRSQSSTTMRENKSTPRDEYSRRSGSNANIIDKPQVDIHNKDKDSSNARNSTTAIHSPKEDKHSSLEKVLLNNDDLRDWLKLTKWDDLAHRKRVLERHRTITTIDTEKALLLESVAKIEALDKEKAKLVAEMAEDEDGFGDKFPRGPPTRSTTKAIGSSDADSVDLFDKAKKPTAASVRTRKRSFSSYSNANHIPLRPNSRRNRATDARRSSPSNSGKEPFYKRHQDHGRSRERRSYEDIRDPSPDLRAFLEREEAREARAAEARRHNAELRDDHRENHRRPYREYRGHGRGRGRGHFEGRW